MTLMMRKNYGFLLARYWVDWLNQLMREALAAYLAT
jgi:hypothetical protein